MNFLDTAILVLMAFLVLRGVMRGFVAEAASLAGVVLGILAGIRFMPRVAELLRPHLSGFSYIQVLSFGLVFIAVLVACALAGWGLKVLFRKTALGWLDRALGAGLAVVKGVVLAYLAMVVLTVYVPPSSPLIARSKLAPVVIQSFQYIRGAIAPDLYLQWKRRLLGPGKPSPEASGGAAGKEALDNGQGTPGRGGSGSR